MPDRDAIMADVRTGSVAASPSPFVAATARIDATDAELRAALADAEVPPLLPALAYLTWLGLSGDASFGHSSAAHTTLMVLSGAATAVTSRLVLIRIGA